MMCICKKHEYGLNVKGCNEVIFDKLDDNSKRIKEIKNLKSKSVFDITTKYLKLTRFDLVSLGKFLP